MKKGFLDQFTSVDELLKENTKQIAKLVQLMQGEEDRDLKIVFYTYPSDGTYISLSAGMLVLDFGVGTISTNGVITPMNHSLQSDDKDFLRSIFIDANKDIVVQLGTQDKIPVKEGKQLLATYQQFKKVTITTTVDTNVFVLCCTNPEAIVQFVNYAMVLKDPDDVFGNPTYVGGGELAARLGSIKTYTKQGEIVYMDDFEDSTLKWWKDTPNTGDSIVRSNDFAHSGNYSIKMTTGDAEDDEVGIYKFFPRPFHNRVGFECSFTVDDETKWFYIKTIIYTGAIEYRGGILYDYQSSKLQYLDNTNTFVDLQGGVKVYPFNTVFHTMKFTFDITALKYLKCFFNNLEIDMSALDIFTDSSGEAPACEVFIYHTTNVALNKYNYMDNFIYTQNEP